MKKGRMPPRKIVKARAKAASFDIEIEAVFTPHGLSSEEVNDVKRKLGQNLTEAVAKLPFAHIFSHEVKIK